MKRQPPPGRLSLSPADAGRRLRLCRGRSAEGRRRFTRHYARQLKLFSSYRRVELLGCAVRAVAARRAKSRAHFAAARRRFARRLAMMAMPPTAFIPPLAAGFCAAMSTTSPPLAMIFAPTMTARRARPPSSPARPRRARSRAKGLPPMPRRQIDARSPARRRTTRDADFSLEPRRATGPQHEMT